MILFFTHSVEWVTVPTWRMQMPSTTVYLSLYISQMKFPYLKYAPISYKILPNKVAWCHVGPVSCRPCVLSASCPVGLVSVGPVSCRLRVLSALCLSALCPVGFVSCRPCVLSASCPVGLVSVGLVFNFIEWIHTYWGKRVLTRHSSKRLGSYRRFRKGF